MEHPIRTLTRHAWSRTGRERIAVFTDSSLLVAEAPHVVHKPKEQGLGRSAVPVRDGRPFLQASKWRATRMARLRDGVRPFQTTPGPRLLMSRWPNSTIAPASSERTHLSITIACYSAAISSEPVNATGCHRGGIAGRWTKPVAATQFVASRRKPICCGGGDLGNCISA